MLPWSPLAGGWLSGRYRRGEARRTTSSRRQRLPARLRPVAAGEPAASSRRSTKLQELADEAGLSLAHLALAFVLEHPAVTSAIIGPRTMEHLESQLDVVKVSLAKDVLDRIDEIVPPGTTLNKADRGYAPPALADVALRRRTA